MSIDLNKQWPAVTSTYTGIKSDGSNTKIPQILDLCRRNKMYLAKMMHIEDTLTVEQEITVDVKKKFSHVLQALLSTIPKDKNITEQELLNNKIESAAGMKASKLLLRWAKENDSYITKWCMTVICSCMYRNHLYEELPKLPNYAEYVNGDTFRIYDFYSTFIQNFFSELAAVQKTLYGFSIEPILMLQAGSSSTFKSCFSVGRFNSKGPLNIALNPFTGVIYNRTANNVTGRAWVLFDQDLQKFVIMKSYGFIDDVTIHKVGSWLCAMLDNKSQWSYTTGSENDVYITLDYTPEGWYIDPVKFFYFSEKSDKVRNIVISGAVDAPCIICGNSTGNSSTLMCRDCMENAFVVCKKCGKTMLKSKDMRTYPLCDHCIQKTTTCPVCGTIVPEGKECHKCAWNHTCSLCGKKHPRPLKWINDVPVCETCISLMHKDTCECCGSVGMVYPYNGHAVCSACYRQLSYYTNQIVSRTQTYLDYDTIKKFVEANPDCGLTISTNRDEHEPEGGGDDDDYDD